jgi:hypothetical protein
VSERAPSEVVGLTHPLLLLLLLLLLQVMLLIGSELMIIFKKIIASPQSVWLTKPLEPSLVFKG